MKEYLVIENGNIGYAGHPEMVATVLYSGSKKECIEYETNKRREYKDRTRVDCFTISKEKNEKIKKFNEYWESLTPEERKEIIEIEGKMYFKRAYEYYNEQETKGQR